MGHSSITPILESENMAKHGWGADVKKQSSGREGVRVDGR